MSSLLCLSLRLNSFRSTANLPSSGRQLQKSKSGNNILLLPQIFSVDPMPSIDGHQPLKQVNIPQAPQGPPMGTFLLILCYCPMTPSPIFPGSAPQPSPTHPSSGQSLLLPPSQDPFFQLNLKSRSTKHSLSHTDLCNPRPSNNSKATLPFPKNAAKVNT